MQKPNGYDETKTSGEYMPIRLGGHYCSIRQVSEARSSKGNDMIIVQVDFCGPDDQAYYFAAKYENDTRPGKKWPFNGTKYIMVYDYDDPGKTSRQFKNFCDLVERTNNISIKWGCDNWSRQFEGKRIGAVYGEEESEYNGRLSMRETLKWFTPWDWVKTAKIPEPKYYNPKGKVFGDSSFVSVPEEDEVPF